NEANLAKISSTLIENNIEFCVFFGTLLGVHRNDSVIPKDDDIDFLIHRDQFNDVIRVMELLESEGYSQTQYFKHRCFCQYKKKFWNFDWLFFRRVLRRIASFLVSKRYKQDQLSQDSFVDFYFYEEKEDVLIEKWNFRGRPDDIENHMHIPKNLIYPIQNLNLNGIDIKVPASILDTCVFLYGPRFMEPLRKYVDYRVTIKGNKPFVEYLT
ncbi:MAG TPA: hypothetical protein DD635_00565, partial [Flavobacteriales bacterium]|nr:hypothetical protein [Flavobacteriales bacterium]